MHEGLDMTKRFSEERSGDKKMKKVFFPGTRQMEHMNVWNLKNIIY
jgi:hypothetical protein